MSERFFWKAKERPDEFPVGRFHLAEVFVLEGVRGRESRDSPEEEWRKEIRASAPYVTVDIRSFTHGMCLSLQVFPYDLGKKGNTAAVVILVLTMIWCMSKYWEHWERPLHIDIGLADLDSGFGSLLLATPRRSGIDWDSPINCEAR